MNAKRLAVMLTVLAIALAACHRGANTIDGVVQDNSGRRVLYWADPMIAQGPPHNYKSNKPGVAPDCNMELMPVYAEETSTTSTAPQPAGTVSLSPQRQQLIGVKLAKAEVRDISRTTRTVGTVAADERRRATIQTKVDGYVESLYVSATGQTVRRGEPLAAIYSPDILATENELLVAAKDRSELGKTLYEAARRRLLLWDMSDAEIDAITRSGRASRTITLRSPVDGVVIVKNVVAGNRIMAGQALYDIADLRQVWIQADVYESELPFVRVGQPALVSLSYYPGRTWSGKISFLSPTVDPATRTAKARIELPNADGALRPDMFADVVLQQPIGNVLTVPDEAVLQTGTRAVVFVSDGNGHFTPRDVQTGAHVGGFWEIRSGLTAGETVVAQANFLIDSESRLRASLR
ncbi:MAG: efflux RND transporter periplasmic adaptor subunit [Thermoanaerobaculia bacterium]